MKLSSYLSIPYVLETVVFETDSGSWVRRFSYPELPNCVVEADDVVDAIDELDRRRILVIVDMLRAGIKPPIPRKPVGIDPVWALDRAGLRDRLSAILCKDEDELRVS